MKKRGRFLRALLAAVLKLLTRRAEKEDDPDKKEDLEDAAEVVDTINELLEGLDEETE